MKITDLAMFMIAFIMMMSGISTLGIFGGGSFTVSTIPEFNGTAMAETLNSVNATQTYEAWGIFSSVGMLFSSANIWMEVVGIVFATGFFIGSIIPFLPAEFCLAITTIVNALYGIAIYQLISGRSEKANG